MDNQNQQASGEKDVSKVMYQALIGAFDYYNKKLFASKLPSCMLTFSRKSKAFGFFVPDLWHTINGEKRQASEIALNPDYMHERGLKRLMSTLVHEMCHLYQHMDGTEPRRCYHNKDFAKKMEAVGLITSTTGEEGGKRVGQKLSHYIVAGGAFDKAFGAMPDKTKLMYEAESLMGPQKIKVKKQAGHKIKYVCPICGASVWGKDGLHIVCEDCDSAMV